MLERQSPATPAQLGEQVQSIYLAGAIHPRDWRLLVVQGLHLRCWDWRAGLPFPVLKKGIFGRYDYTGPYWPFARKNYDHHEASIQANIYCKGLGDETYWVRCKEAISQADLVFAFFEGNVKDTYWRTFSQLCYARILGKQILCAGEFPADEFFLLDGFLAAAPAWCYGNASARNALAKLLGLSDADLNRQAGHGCVYFIENPSAQHIKIGWAKDPKKRLASFQTGASTKYNLLGMIPGSRHLEKKLHHDFRELKVRGEWFFATKPLRDFIATEIAPNTTGCEGQAADSVERGGR